LFLGQFLSPLLAQPIADRFGEARVYPAAGIFLLVIMIVVLLISGQLQRWTTATVMESA
jgi:hypothetical protein